MLFDHLPLIARPQLYLDPGSGSFIVQLLLAIGLGIGVAAKMYWAKLKSLFTGKKDAPLQADADDEDDEQSDD